MYKYKIEREMMHMLYECKADECAKGLVKTHERCKLKAEEEFRNGAFPKCALVIDVVRCCAIFDSIEKLHKGLEMFREQIKAYPRKESKKEIHLEIMRVKNGFAHYKRQPTSQTNSVYSDKLRLPIPSTFTNVKFNIIFTDLRQKESVVGEVQFLLKSMVELHKKQYNFIEIKRRANHIHGVFEQFNLNTFDFQLKMAGFNSGSLCPLMLHHPLEFCKSDLILRGQDNSGDQFLGSMAYNCNVKYQCARELIQRLIPHNVVQKQLFTAPRSGICINAPFF
ncbi:hypothetical protein RFI_29956 [Reticulomyxa filosa]|uniref:Uncharacterized protein n=1 Tax=Reticulomyxa filosa TaxID=46433 RepID=X6LZV3_RETFI|nr:hypothetical protein RFI_29956 [Reticulomyxa filosa]|eukprot:ETO07433.1 hypothetical protein RFI_29956 [Reticulomyxa filosa]